MVCFSVCPPTPPCGSCHQAAIHYLCSLLSFTTTFSWTPIPAKQRHHRCPMLPSPCPMPPCSVGIPPSAQPDLAVGLGCWTICCVPVVLASVALPSLGAAEQVLQGDDRRRILVVMSKHILHGVGRWSGVNSVSQAPKINGMATFNPLSGRKPTAPPTSAYLQPTAILQDGSDPCRFRLEGIYPIQSSFPNICLLYG